MPVITGAAMASVGRSAQIWSKRRFNVPLVSAVEMAHREKGEKAIAALKGAQVGRRTINKRLSAPIEWKHSAKYTTRELMDRLPGLTTIAELVRSQRKKASEQGLETARLKFADGVAREATQHSRWTRRMHMLIQEFVDRLERTIVRYDLLRHPFYQAWSRGELTREDLQEYAKEYYQHVVSFPRCLVEFARRLEDGELREAVLSNLRDEVGSERGRPHADLWLDFAEGIGAGRRFDDHEPTFQMKELISFFRKAAKEGTPEQTLAAFYAYESQVPRVAREKWRGLKERYGANDHTCGYFILHMTADVYHARVWRAQLEGRLRANPHRCDSALHIAEATALLLWEVLDGIENLCIQRLLREVR